MRCPDDASACPPVPSSLLRPLLPSPSTLLLPFPMPPPEPKPKEPTAHQYDYDAQTVICFLKTYGLDKDFKVGLGPRGGRAGGPETP